jgi:hypothetical protein
LESGATTFPRPDRAGKYREATWEAIRKEFSQEGGAVRRELEPLKAWVSAEESHVVKAVSSAHGREASDNAKWFLRTVVDGDTDCSPSSIRQALAVAGQRVDARLEILGRRPEGRTPEALMTAVHVAWSPILDTLKPALTPWMHPDTYRSADAAFSACGDSEAGRACLNHAIRMRAVPFMEAPEGRISEALRHDLTQQAAWGILRHAILDQDLGSAAVTRAVTRAFTRTPTLHNHAPLVTHLGKGRFQYTDLRVAGFPCTAISMDKDRWSVVVAEAAELAIDPSHRHEARWRAVSRWPLDNLALTVRKAAATLAPDLGIQAPAPISDAEATSILAAAERPSPYTIARSGLDPETQERLEAEGLVSRPHLNQELLLLTNRGTALLNKEQACPR